MFKKSPLSIKQSSNLFVYSGNETPADHIDHSAEVMGNVTQELA